MSDSITHSRKNAATTHLLGWMLIISSVALAYLLSHYPTHAATVRTQDIQAGMRSPLTDGTYACVSADSTGTRTGFGRCKTPTGDEGSVRRFETDLRYGAFVIQNTDLEIKDVFDVPLTRCYSSNDWAGSSLLHAFGFNANHQYDIQPVGDRNPYSYLLLVLEDGDILHFRRISQGTGFADAVYLHTETSTRFYKATIAWNGNGWTLRLADGTEILFPDGYSAKNMAQGAPIEMRTAGGDKLELQRDHSAKLRKILTPHGDWIQFHYDSQARITGVEDSEGDWAKYTYNPRGMLASTVSSRGGSFNYEYEGHFMTAVKDKDGRVLVRNWYNSGGRLASQLFANGDLYRYRYNWQPSLAYADAVTITLPDNTEKTIAVARSVPSYIARN